MITSSLLRHAVPALALSGLAACQGQESNSENANLEASQSTYEVELECTKTQSHGTATWMGQHCSAPAERSPSWTWSSPAEPAESVTATVRFFEDGQVGLYGAAPIEEFTGLLDQCGSGSCVVRETTTETSSSRQLIDVSDTEVMVNLTSTSVTSSPGARYSDPCTVTATTLSCEGKVPLQPATYVEAASDPFLESSCPGEAVTLDELAVLKQRGISALYTAYARERSCSPEGCKAWRSNNQFKMPGTYGYQDSTIKLSMFSGELAFKDGSVPVLFTPRRKDSYYYNIAASAPTGTVSMQNLPTIASEGSSSSSNGIYAKMEGVTTIKANCARATFRISDIWWGTKVWNEQEVVLLASY